MANDMGNTFDTIVDTLKTILNVIYTSDFFNDLMTKFTDWLGGFSPSDLTNLIMEFVMKFIDL